MVCCCILSLGKPTTYLSLKCHVMTKPAIKVESQQGSGSSQCFAEVLHVWLSTHCWEILGVRSMHKAFGSLWQHSDSMSDAAWEWCQDARQMPVLMDCGQGMAADRSPDACPDCWVNTHVDRTIKELGRCGLSWRRVMCGHKGAMGSEGG